MRAKDIMSKGVMSLSHSSTIYEAIAMLVGCRVSAMPVLDEDGFMIGIVSEADMLQRVEESRSEGRSSLSSDLAVDAETAAALDYARSHRVVDVMTKNVITADENASLAEVAELMRKHRVKRVPIERDRSVVGIVSRVDLLRALLLTECSISAPQPAITPLVSADERLRRDVMKAVQRKSWSLARRADVAVKDGVVHLWGMAPTASLRQAYLMAAETVPGVKAVESHMHIVS